MARPKSEDKRNAILSAAIKVFAEKGIWSTPTSAISKAAGVADGTLFTYFATKDVLLDELYRALKLELAEVLLGSMPRQADLRGKLQHFWNRYVRWGAANPEKLKVMTQLQLSDQISAASKAVGAAPFAEIEQLARDSIASQQIYDYPVDFIAGIFNSMAETTMAALAGGGQDGVDYCAAGFELFWRAIARG